MLCGRVALRSRSERRRHARVGRCPCLAPAPMVPVRMSTVDTLVHRSVLTAADVRALDECARAVEAWPIGSHVWGHYAEMTDQGPAVCRTENVSACAPVVAALVDGPL